MSTSVIVRANIKKELKEAEKSVNELALRLGVSRQTASSKLNGHSPFTFDELDSVVAWLNISREALFTEEEFKMAS